MPKPLSMDLRKRIAAARAAGLSSKEVAERFCVSERGVRKLLQHRRETGALEPRRGKVGRKAKLAEHLEELRELVARQPDAVLHELRDGLSVQVSQTAVWRALRGLGLSLKKSHTGRRAATTRRATPS